MRHSKKLSVRHIVPYMKSRISRIKQSVDWYCDLIKEDRAIVDNRHLPLHSLALVSVTSIEKRLRVGTTQITKEDLFPMFLAASRML